MVGLLEGINVGGSVNNIVVGVYWILAFLLVGGLIVFIYWWSSHKVDFTIRVVAGDRTLIIRDKAKIVRRKGVPVKWKLRKRGDYVPVPPKNAIDVTTKGKLCVEAYYTEDGEYHYIIDEHNTNNRIGSLHPVKNVDKEFFVQQVEEGQKYKKKSLSDILLQLAPVMAIVLILVLFMIFFNDVVQPSIDMGNQLSGIASKLADAVNTLQCSQNVEIVPN